MAQAQLKYRNKRVPSKKPAISNMKVIIQKLIKNDEEYREKIKLGEMIHKNVIKYAIHEASIPIEYQEPLEIYMKQNKDCQTNESNIVTNSNQSETILLEDSTEVLKIYKLLQRMKNKSM